ncbi:MAG TPA: DMT family transporter [Streptosporangiaceae bacterium]|nr:DMT family transporter [Streptosporangiaceae bacterium]
MSATALVLILIAAIAHATWNLFSKQASVSGPTSFVWLMALLGTVLYAPVVAVALLLSPPRLTAEAWVFLTGTGLLQVGYFLFLQTGYARGDLSLVYPVGRGSGALLAALAGIVLLGERPGPAGLAGIALVVLGVLMLGAHGTSAGRTDTSPGSAGIADASPGDPSPGDPSPDDPSPGDTAAQAAARAATITRERPRPTPRPGPWALAFALVTGLFIATYTLWDKYAVSTLGVPPLLQGYASLPVMVLVIAPFALRERSRTTRVWRDYRRQVAGAAVLSPLAYILVLIALSFTAVAAVAPAREVSVLAGVLLGRTMLGEAGLAWRLAAAGAIAAGIICIAVG